MSPVLQILQLPFVQIALPLMVVLIVNAWGQNKRIDDLRADMNRRFDGIEKRLERIEAKLDDHQSRIVTLEERTSPLRGR